MATIQIRAGDKLFSRSFPDDMSVRQATRLIAVQDGHFDWWHGDWVLVLEESPAGDVGEPPTALPLVPHDDKISTIDGHTVRFGWFQLPEIWN